MSDKQYTDEQIYAAREQLWRMGNLQWKLSPPQKRMYDFWHKLETKQSVINAGRRVGKTYWLTIIALEQCLQHPKSIVKFFQPEKGQVTTNVTPVMNLILEDCPNDLRPKWESQKSQYKFSNGSVIQLGGTDKGNHEKLRGGDAHLCLIDEAGFLKVSLGYLVRAILGPSTMRTFGKIVMSSSTPTNPKHEFLDYMARAKQNEALFAVTSKEAVIEHEAVNDDRYTWAMYNGLVDSYPKGEEDDDFKRECLNELIIDANLAIVPEFTAEIQRECILDWAMPPYCDRYVAMDIGFRDLTVALFGFYDFQHDAVVIQDEIVMNGPSMTTDKLAQKIYDKEYELWLNARTGELMDPHKRVADNNNLNMLNDLRLLYGLNFQPTAKKDKESNLNVLRTRMSNFQIYISPKCKTLIDHLKTGTWNAQRSSFARSADMGHFDAIDALIYFVRNIDFGKNPYPRNYNLGFLGGDVFIKPGYEPPENDYSDFKQLFTLKKK